MSLCLFSKIQNKLLKPTTVLIFLSLCFYSVSSFTNLIILLSSILLNYFFSRLSIEFSAAKAQKFLFLLASLMVNLGILVYFKYTLLDINPLTISRDFDTATHVILPLGISFYTFQQISYQVDCYWGKVDKIEFSYYVLYVCCFPQLVAGPIVHHAEVIPQYKKLSHSLLSISNLRVATALFVIGLFKKVAIADQLGLGVDGVYRAVSLDLEISLLDSWAAAIAFPLQIYFDFSGYSDMACALALMFGVKLPLNFNSPFKKTSLVQFWASWHMTLMRFFKNYIFTPLSFTLTRKTVSASMNKYSMFLVTLAFPVFVSFLLTGIWHGSGLTFLYFGLIHGILVSINHGWKLFNLPRIWSGFGWALTMLTVCVTFVFLRVPNVDGLKASLAAMFGVNLRLPSFMSAFLPNDLSVSYYKSTFEHFDGGVVMIAFMVLVLLGCLLFPNSNQLLWSSKTVLDHANLAKPKFEVKWNSIWGAGFGFLFAISILLLNYRNSNFIYFQF